MVAAGCSAGDWRAVEARWTLIMYYAMVEHWKRNGPPVYLSVAGYLGLVKPGSSGTKSEGSGGFEDLDHLAEQFPGGMIQ